MFVSGALAVTAASALAAGSVTSGALAPAFRYCVSDESPASSESQRFDASDPSLPEIVRNFLAVPPRFDGIANLTILRVGTGEGSTAWVVKPRSETCEFMLTGSPHHLAERDALLRTTSQFAASDPRLAAALPFWSLTFPVASESGETRLVRLQGTGANNTKRENIQIDFAILGVVAPR